MTLSDKMHGKKDGEENKFYGVVIGLVTNIDDPNKEGRVKVKFPWLSSDDESYWARLTQIMAGKNRGVWIIPEVGDEVLVAFEHGDVNHPYVLGSLYNGQDTPPSENQFSSDNNLRMIKSRSGHIITLDDTSGSEQITITAAKGKSKVIIKSDGNIEISSDNIKITATQNLEMEGQTVKITAKMQLKCEGQAGFELKSGANGDVKATGMLNVKGAVVNLN